MALKAPRLGKRTASDWIVRLNADDCSDIERHAFRTWLSSDRRNAEEFERLTDLWDIVPGTRLDVPSRAPIVSRERSISRRKVMAGFIGAASLGAAGLAIEPALAVDTYETGTGASRRIVLSDGSVLTLDARTRIRVRTSLFGRDAWLDEGRIALDVAKGRTAFRIDTGDGLIRVQHGTLDLLHGAGEPDRFTVIRGKAEVRLPGVSRILDQGERLTREDKARLVIDRPDLPALKGWENKRLSFDNDTLAHVAWMANRYSTTKLVLKDAQTARIRISGIYSMGDAAALANALADGLELGVEPKSGAVVLGPRTK